MAMIGISDLAGELGTTPQKLRKFLRANFERVDRGKKYEWEETNFELDTIRDKWKATGGSSSKRQGTSRKARTKAARDKGYVTLDLNADGPVASPEHTPCSWCSAKVELIEVYVQVINPEEDQKIAKYECTNPDCGVEYPVILTLGGWKAPDALTEVLRMEPLT